MSAPHVARSHDPRIDKLIEGLRDDLRERFAGDAETLVTLFAASELWIERDTSLDASAPLDAEALRFTAARLVLQMLGVNDASVEASKMQLAEWKDIPSLNRRN